MDIIVENNVKEYLYKNSSYRIIIDMIPDRTSACCGTGKTKKFYVPFIRLLGIEETPGKGYTKYSQEGIDIYISDKARAAAEEIVTIYIEKTLIISNLAIKGIGYYIPQEQ